MKLRTVGRGPLLRSVDRAARRRGSIAVVALVVLGVMSALVAQHARRVLMERRDARQQRLEWQAEKLADAGLLRAQQAIQTNAAWPGTTWQIAAGTIHQTNSGTVAITVQENVCTVVARYPDNSSSPVQVTRSMRLMP